MGSTNLYLLSSSLNPIINYFPLNPTKTPLNPNFNSQFHPQLSSTQRCTNSNAFRGEKFEFGDDFRRNKRRNWWSDDDDDDDEDDEDEDEDGEFGFWEERNSVDWIFKVVSIFGWAVPAVIISMLLGTGTNSLAMALIVPLGQTALSLVMDRLGGSPRSSPNASPRYKPRPRSRNRRSAQTREAQSRSSPGRRGYQSWRTTHKSSVKEGQESGSRFGGWDELDEQVGGSSGLSRERESQEVNVVRRQEILAGKLSRTRNGEKPLFMRLLIAVFPLLGSWTRFLF